MVDNDDIKKEIKAKLDIVSLIGETVKLTKRGDAYRGAISPTSKSGASLVVDPRKQVYDDKAGHAGGGDIFNWIAYTEGLDYVSDFSRVLEIAAEKAGVVLEHQSTDELNEKATLYPFLRAVAGYYHDNLTHEGRKYIHDKWGISDEMIDKLMIGWAPGNGALLTEMKKLFPLDVLKMSGLFRVSSNGIEDDFFSERIIFPYWKGSRPVYFIGRYPKWTTDCGRPKYTKQTVHSDENPHVSKLINNSVFYGEDSIKKADSVIITEGVTDCIKVLQEGLACISPVTVRIKEDQKEYAYQLTKNKSEVIICNDNEDNDTGKDGAIATAVYLESKGVPVRVVELPRPAGVDKIDLAEFLQTHTKEEFQQLESNNVWEIKLQSQNVPDGNIEKTRAVKRFVLNDLKQMEPSARDIFIRNEVREYFGLRKSDMNTILKSVKWDDDEDIPVDEDLGFFSKAGRLQVKKLSEYVMSLARFITFEDTKNIYIYKNGVYVPRGEDTIARIVQNALGDSSKKHHIAEIVNYIQLETLIPRSKINHDVHKINLLNGLFNLDSGELEPHSPDYISIVQIPVTYDPDATCPAVDKFIGEVLEEKYHDVIYEILGYCMIPDTRIEKSIMFLGKGANGKSVMLSMFGEFLGANNVSAESLHMLEKDPYSLAELYGKLANIFPDLASGALYENSTFKMLTGNEKEIRAQRKYEHPFKFKNTARLVFSANELPPVPGHDFAYFRRWILLKFPYTFEGDKADKNLLQKITTAEEMSGLFNKCIVALRGLLARCEYSYDMSTDDVMKLYKINSDPIAAFADEMVVYSEKDTLKAKMLDEYTLWCQKNNIEPVHPNVFSKRFVKLGYTTGRESTGERRTTWQNCVIKDNVRAEKNSPDGKNKEQESNPSERHGISSHCNNKESICNIDNEKEEYVYVNNGEKSGFALTDEDKCSLLQSENTRQGRNNPCDIAMTDLTLGQKINFVRELIKQCSDLKEVHKRIKAAEIKEGYEIISKLHKMGEVVILDGKTIRLVGY
jgi:phage/plasmid primase, P4 family, C-terminal domain